MTDQPAPPESAPEALLDTGTQAANELGEFRSLKADVWRQFRRHKGAMGGVIMPISSVLATIMPIQIGCSPSATKGGTKIGTVRNITEIGSTIQPSASSKTT